MKKTRYVRGFIVPLIIIAVGLLLIGGVYIYNKSKQPGGNPIPTNNLVLQSPTSSPTQSPVSSNSPSTYAVAGMSKYTDSDFGFSFWYPSTSKVVVLNSNPFGGNPIEKATIVKRLGVIQTGQSYPDILIEEAHSSTLTITDTGGAGPFGPVTYFFNPPTHTWMVVNSGELKEPAGTTTADVSINTMGGLHMFGGTSRFGTTIIPLSADNFVVISNGGGLNSDPLVKTVVALDPSVATPVSQDEQNKIIQAEASALAQYSPYETSSNSDWKTYTNSKYDFSVKYPADWKAYEMDYSYIYNQFQTTPVPGNRTIMAFAPIDISPESNAYVIKITAIPVNHLTVDEQWQTLVPSQISTSSIDNKGSWYDYILLEKKNIGGENVIIYNVVDYGENTTTHSAMFVHNNELFDVAGLDKISTTTFDLFINSVKFNLNHNN